MELLLNALLHTNELSDFVIQQIFVVARKSEYKDNVKEWDKISQILWLHLQSKVLKTDDQLLCATCFYTILPLTGREQFYLNEVLQIIKKETHQRKSDAPNQTNTAMVVSLMYGIFQSSYLITTLRKADESLTALLDSSIDLLIQLAYDYSRNTFIVFKTISSFKKVCGSQLQDCIYTKGKQVKLLNLVNHNWENPITGVRDLNKIIFQTLVSLMDENAYQAVLMEINSFYWNKAKYLMLSEMIEQCSRNMCDLVTESDWLAGLSSSLQKPGLVSAGTDMYFAILKRLVSEDDWIKVFHPTVTTIFNSKSSKTVENFSKYWCLTTLKKFPALINVFEEIFEKIYDVDKKLYNSLSVLKQANKLGIVTKNWNSSADYKLLESMVVKGVEHGNAYIRMMTFDILCEFQGKTMPSQVEYGLIFNYVKNNMNSDCTVLRLNMLNSLKNFLMQIQILFITHSNRGTNIDLQNLQKFLNNMQLLVITNLRTKGNYQRKITSVKVCSILWGCLRDIPKLKKNQIVLCKCTLLKMLIEKDQWLLSEDNFIKELISFLRDPSDDIRENVVQLLLNYYSSEFKKSYLLNHVIGEALKCIGGKFFYEISCGQSMFKLIVSVLLKEKIKQATFETAEDVITFASNELINEHDLKRDVLDSIENGKQLHSFMDIILVVLDVSYRKCYKVKLPDKEILELIKCLEDISNHFACDESSSSSDFSKMNDMVEQIIDNYGFTSKEDGDDAKISGIHQMVLNCIWLNVKACCDVASLLIRHCDDVTHIEKCLLIITRVLESSRHKGAIESAGAALGQAIQYLLCLSDKPDLSNIPHALLKSKLKELIMEASKMASTTRRGAGLSIMVHRIVSSDMKKDKPLFHYFMNKILETCSHLEDLPTELKEKIDIDNEKDLPKAIYIHFLTRIVVDSSIASDVMYYSPELAKLAFDNLTSSHWQIRNAALQLYGALVPKLIGQKKASGSGEETIVTVACDEIRTHSPKLWTHINDQLRNINTTDKIISHSILMPLLNMLANSAMRYNFSHDKTDKDSESILFQSLMSLFDSPLYCVRRLAAKSIINIFSFNLIYDYLVEHELRSENYLHGVLNLISHCYIHYTDDTHCAKFQNLNKLIQNKLVERDHSYLCKELYEEMFLNLNTDNYISAIQHTISELDGNIYAPGIFNWANARIKKCIQNIPWNEIPILLKMFLNRCEFEFCCEILLEKIKSFEDDISKEPLQEISKLFLSCEHKYNSSAIWRILYEIAQLVDLNCCTETLVEAVKANGISYKLRYILPFIVKVESHKKYDNNLEYLSSVILSLCDPETVDVEMRYIAALSNNEMSSTFKILPDSIKISTIKAAVILLQDEDEDVRNLSTVFYKNISQAEIRQHPYICLGKMLDSKVLNSILMEPQYGIGILKKDLMEKLSKISSHIPDENYNPFANVSKNIYLEVEILQGFIECLH